jgi:5-guanidino-2-oxopentanoate decarboxylase
MTDHARQPLGVQISQMLQSRGVQVIFGIPGVHNQELYRGIEQAGLRHILARHEQGVGFMADGYARATGRPGVCYVITGPGLCNIMTPMGQAYSDSVPMLVISSCLNPADLGRGRGRLHEMKDQRAAAETVTDWSIQAADAAGAYHLIDRALHEFQVGRARPKHIQVPIRVLEGMADPAPDWHGPPALAGVGQAGAVDLAPLIPLLSAAHHPLVILGGGAVRAAVLPLVQRMGAAVFETQAGRGIVPPDYPLHFGAMLEQPDAEAVVGSADLVIAIGTELSEVDLWRENLGHRVPLIRVDIDPQVLTSADTGVGVLAEAGQFIQSLDAALGPDWPAATGWTHAEVAAKRLAWRRSVMAEYPGLAALIDGLRAAVPPQTMIYSDMTQLAYAALMLWPMDRPGHWHHPSGFGTLGYALPAAIGGSIGRPGLPTMAIVGDYGFQYTLPELATAVELRLPLPIILWDNGKLGAIEASMVKAQIAPNAVIQQNPDFVALARAYGAFSAAPRSLAALGDAVRAAFAAGGPTVIHVTPETART